MFDLFATDITDGHLRPLLRLWGFLLRLLCPLLRAQGLHLGNHHVTYHWKYSSL